jgi:hypothetical protein
VAVGLGGASGKTCCSRPPRREGNLLFCLNTGKCSRPAAFVFCLLRGPTWACPAGPVLTFQGQGWVRLVTQEAGIPGHLHFMNHGLGESQLAFPRAEMLDCPGTRESNLGLGVLTEAFEGSQRPGRAHES